MRMARLHTGRHKMHGAVPLVPRRDARGDHGHGRPAPLAVRAGPAGLRAVLRAVPLPLVVPRDDAGGGVPARARPRRGDPAVRGGPDGRRDHGRADRRHERHPRAARRLPAGPPGDHAQARHPADLRRGDGGLRSRRRLVRLADLGRRARPDHLRQGHQLRLRAARRRADLAEGRRHLPRAALSRRPDVLGPSAGLRGGRGVDRGLQGGGDRRARVRDRRRGARPGAARADGAPPVRSARCAAVAASGRSSS